jgi:hypothetical protein
MKSSTITRRGVVLSFLVSAGFGIALVIQGLFVQEPISHFTPQKQSGISPTMDMGFASSEWHPQWFRARVFYLTRGTPIDVDLSKKLHHKWFFLPSLSLDSVSLESLHRDAPTGSDIMLEFSEVLYYMNPQTLHFVMESPHAHQMRIDGTLLPSYQNITLSKGLHRWSGRILLSSSKTLTLSARMSREDKKTELWAVGKAHSYDQSLGINRTGFRFDVLDIFEKGSASFREGTHPLLEDLWFGINEGRFLGRVVIEVHNHDAGISLSQSRALKIAKWLVEKGAPSKLITVQGYGDHWLSETEPGRLMILLLH